MMNLKTVFRPLSVATILLLLTSSCGKDLNVRFTRFDQWLYSALDSITVNQMPPLYEGKDSLFANFFYERILTLKDRRLVKNYFSNPQLSKLYETTQKIFPSLSDEEKQLSKAMTRYTKMFPDRTLPLFYTDVSGWQQQVVVAPEWIALSLDHYLGEDYAPYKQYFYDYEWHRKSRQYIVRDIVEAMLLPILAESNNDAQTLLEQMVEEGRKVWLMKEIMPKEKEEILFGFTKEKMKWCTKNENKMWNTIVQNNALFESDEMILRFYLSDGPFTNAFSEESPAQAVKYIGYRIVEQYLKNSSGNDLTNVLKKESAQTILQTAGYSGQ